MTTDDFPLTAWSKRRARLVPRCDHATCPGCSSCSCHRKPKQPILGPLTQPEAVAEGARLKLAAIRAVRMLDAISSTDKKTRPVSNVEQAIARGHADLDAALRSPTLNGAVSGGDDPSWRIFDSLVDREFLDESGNVIKGGNIRDRFDATTLQLETLVGALEQIERSAALANDIVDQLRAIPAAEAQRLLEADSDVQHCVNCGKPVTGTRDDRLRSGRCSTCNTYRSEHGGRDRPRSLIEKELEREMAAASTIPATPMGKFSSESPEVGS